MTDYTIFGRNRELIAGTYTPEDTVTFVGTRGNDTLLGGGGEGVTYFRGSRGNDLFGGSDLFSFSYADYSDAPRGIVVNMNITGTRTFTDESGDVRTVSILGMALKDGFGGVDYFMEHLALGGGFSSVSAVIGSDFGDVLIGSTFELHGGGGSDLLIGTGLFGDDGDDIMIARSSDGSSIFIEGGGGGDFIRGSGDSDVKLSGGDGDDRILARGGNDRWVTGEAGNDYVNGGAGDDFIDSGIGSDTLVSGSGNDIINPDVEFFQLDPDQPTDSARDVIQVSRADLGDFSDFVLSQSFEAGRDEIRFRNAVAGGKDYRIYYEAETINEATGRPLNPDRSEAQNTVLQIDWNGNGFGDGAPDAEDYFLTVIDVTLTEQDSFILT